MRRKNVRKDFAVPLAHHLTQLMLGAFVGFFILKILNHYPLVPSFHFLSGRKVYFLIAYGITLFTTIGAYFLWRAELYFLKFWIPDTKWAAKISTASKLPFLILAGFFLSGLQPAALLKLLLFAALFSYFVEAAAAAITYQKNQVHFSKDPLNKPRFQFAVAGFVITLLALTQSLSFYFVFVLREYRLLALGGAFLFLVGVFFAWYFPAYLENKSKPGAFTNSLVAQTVSFFPLCFTLLVAFCFPSQKAYLTVGLGAIAASFIIWLTFRVKNSRHLKMWLSLAASNQAHHFFILFAVFLIFLSPHARFLTLDDGAEGIKLGIYHGILHGQWPVTEVGYGYGPLLYWLHFLLTHLFGGTIFAARITFLTVNFFTFIIFYVFLCRLVSSEKLRYFGGLFFLCFTSLSYLVTCPTLFFGTIILLRIGVASVSILFLLKFLQSPSGKWIFWSGFFAAASFFYSMEYGIAAILTCLLYFALSFFKRPFNALVNLALFLIGSAILSAFVFIPYAVHGVGPLHLLSAMTEVIFDYTGSGLINPQFNFMPIETYTGSDYFQEILAYLLSWKLQLLLPLFICSLTPILIYLLFIRNEGLSDRAKQLFALWGFSSICYMVPFLTQNSACYLYNSSAPVIILSLCLAEKYAQKGSANFLNSKIIKTIFWVWFIFTYNGLGAFTAEFFVQRIKRLAELFPKSELFKNEKSGGVYIASLQARFYEDFVAALEKTTLRQEKILITPCSGVLLFLSDRLNATRYFFIGDTMVGKKQEKEIVKKLKDLNVQHVVEVARQERYTELNHFLDTQFKRTPFSGNIVLHTKK